MLGAYLVFFTTMIFMPLWLAMLIIGFALLVFYRSFFLPENGVPRLVWLLAALLIASSALAGFYLPASFQPPWVLAVLFAIAVTSACGIMVDRVAYRPLRDAPRISALISAIGISFFIENLGVVLFTGLPRPVLQPDILVKPLSLGAIRIVPMALIVPVVSFLLIAGLLFVLYRTKPGLAMRSISKDIETTRLMGVSVDRIVALTFGLGSALAAAAGIMWALRYPQIHPYMGVLPGFKAFIAAVFGGIGSIQGAMVGGMRLGFIEIMVIAFFPQLSGYRDAFAFILLIVILLWRPSGLLGEKLEDKI
jgi:branched-chain amino acid transport system permease protein